MLVCSEPHLVRLASKSCKGQGWQHRHTRVYDAAAAHFALAEAGCTSDTSFLSFCFSSDVHAQTCMLRKGEEASCWRTLRMTRLMKNSSCSDTGSTSGPSVVMLAFSAWPAMDIRSLDRYTPAARPPLQPAPRLLGALHHAHAICSVALSSALSDPPCQ